METIRRLNCCFCQNPNLIPHKTIENFPIYMGTTIEEEDKDIFHDQNWSVCSRCGCLQLVNLIPLDVLYSNNHSEEVVGATWNRHHEEFAKFILKSNQKNICEIGSAHGYLSNLILKTVPNLEYMIIEPSPSNLDSRIKYVKGFVEDNLNEISRFSTIVHSHVLEHVYSANDFLSAISSKMKSDTQMYISFPNIKRLLETNGTNSLNFEHTYFLELIQLESLLRTFQLEVIEQRDFERHSHFMRIRKNVNLPKNSKIVDNNNLVILFDEMWNYLEEFTTKTIDKISDHKVKTFIFGAHIFSQGLHNLGFSKIEIEGVLDNAPSKIGERLYGTPYGVFHPSKIEKYDEVRVILKTSHYQDEIREQLISLNPRVQILE